MAVHHTQLEVRTHGKGTYEITDNIQAKIDRSGLRSGTITVFIQHTSCSLTMMENAAPAARRPENTDYFEHGEEGRDDMPSHIRTVLTRTSETVPIIDGKMQLGTWQGIFLFEHRRDPHRRKVCITIIGE